MELQEKQNRAALLFRLLFTKVNTAGKLSDYKQIDSVSDDRLLKR